jgi:hypothetical protein
MPEHMDGILVMSGQHVFNGPGELTYFFPLTKSRSLRNYRKKRLFFLAKLDENIGFTMLRRHLHGYEHDPSCRGCVCDLESSTHLLTECPGVVLLLSDIARKPPESSSCN